jgi:P pilus assembly chaperone PapD
MPIVAAAIAALVMSLGSPRDIRAKDVSPMVAKITPSGSGSSYRLTVRNDSAAAATIEIEVYRMQVDETGARSLAPEDNDIVVFPVQSVIPPNREQVVQVRYLGEASNEGRMYLIRAAQLPINMQTTTADGEAGADIKVAFNINTYVFVAPASARGAVEVTSVSRASNGDVLLSARNTGSGFAHLREARFTLTTADGKAHEIPAADVDVGEVSVIAGGATRQIRIPAALAAAATGDVTASIALL